MTDREPSGLRRVASAALGAAGGLAVVAALWFLVVLPLLADDAGDELAATPGSASVSQPLQPTEPLEPTEEPLAPPLPAETSAGAVPQTFNVFQARDPFEQLVQPPDPTIEPTDPFPTGPLPTDTFPTEPETTTPLPTDPDDFDDEEDFDGDGIPDVDDDDIDDDGIPNEEDDDPYDPDVPGDDDFDDDFDDDVDGDGLTDDIDDDIDGDGIPNEDDDDPYGDADLPDDDQTTPTPTPTATPSPSSEASVGATTIALVDVFVDDDGEPAALVTVNGTGYEVREGDPFATRFQIIDISGDCGTFLFGDNRFTLCEGQEIRK